MKRALFVLALVLAGAGQSHSEVITLDDFSGNETLIDFGDADQSVPNPYIASGVSFLVRDEEFQGAAIYSTYSDSFDNIPGASLGGAYYTGLVTPTMYMGNSFAWRRSNVRPTCCPAGCGGRPPATISRVCGWRVHARASSGCASL